MFAFIVSRLLQALPVMLVVALISFAMFAYVGDPVAIMLGQDFTEAQRQALVRNLGLDQPFVVQFARFVGNAVQGEFGLSYRLSRPVAELIARMKTEAGPARQAAIREGLRLYREDVPHVPLHHQMIPWAVRSNLSIPHAANNQPYFRWAVVN